MQPCEGSALVGMAGWWMITVLSSSVTCRVTAHTGPSSLIVHFLLPLAGSYPLTSAMPLLAYTLSVSHEPETTTLSSSLVTAGIGTWKSTLEAGSEGAFSSAPEALPPSPPFWSVPPSPPVPPLEPAVSSLPPPSEDPAYQTPPPMIRAIATTADTMIATCALIFRPPPAACGCMGMVAGCG